MIPTTSATVRGPELTTTSTAATCRRAFRRRNAQRLSFAPARSHVAGAEERYLRFLEHLEERRKLISEHVGDLAYEALKLLPIQRIAEKEQVANVCVILSKWIAEEITSPMPRGRDGLERRDKDSPLWLMMTLLER